MQLNCLTSVAYNEARGEGIEGMTEVSRVVLNRVASPVHPNTVCEVVNQRKQFSYGEPLNTTQAFSMAYHNPRVHNEKSWGEAMLSVVYSPKFTGATHFHTVDTNPYWTSDMIKLGQVGNHIFYRRK